MTALHFTEALLPTGWARDVRIDVAGGRIAAVTPGASSDGCELAGIALPGLASLHSHAFQRGWRGSPSTGAAARTASGRGGTSCTASP